MSSVPLSLLLPCFWKLVGELGRTELDPQAAGSLPPTAFLFSSKLKPKQKIQSISSRGEGTVCLVSLRAAVRARPRVIAESAVGLPREALSITAHVCYRGHHILCTYQASGAAGDFPFPGCAVPTTARPFIPGPAPVGLLGAHLVSSGCPSLGFCVCAGTGCSGRCALLAPREKFRWEEAEGYAAAWG